MSEFLTAFFEVTWAIVKNMHLWLILSAFVTLMAMKEGLIQVAVGFAGLFFLILFLGWDKILGDYIMVHGMIAVGLGLLIAFFIWEFKE